MKISTALLFFVLFLSAAMPGQAHHVLGRPAYNLNEDSNTPPSMEVETQIGDYYVTYMAFPAFPRPGKPGRVNLYASHIDSGKPFSGQVTFRVRNDGWFVDGDPEILGRQELDDGVFRQGFLFKNKGDYIVTAEFEAGNEPYIIDFPLRIGTPSPVGPVSITLAILFIFLITISIIQRRRLLTAKIRQDRDSSIE
ncbi:MAG: hypothetical protein GY862_22970 [Gammaproteobacteria bacterium]|nr:hypothetical protein [Gammaproteobacteria bacterium]